MAPSLITKATLPSETAAHSENLRIIYHAQKVGDGGGGGGEYAAGGRQRAASQLDVFHHETRVAERSREGGAHRTDRCAQNGHRIPSLSDVGIGYNGTILTTYQARNLYESTR